MLLRIFETPLIDVLLIVLAIRFIWPQLFGLKSRKRTTIKKQNGKPFVHENSAASNSKYSRNEGEYIDYEEIK